MEKNDIITYLKSIKKIGVGFFDLALMNEDRYQAGYWEGMMHLASTVINSDEENLGNLDDFDIEIKQGK